MSASCGGRTMRAVAMAVVALVGLAAAQAAEARSYQLNRTDVTAEVREDGSMRVSETREVVFRGTFRAFDRVIPLHAGTGIENVSVSEGGTRYREMPGEAPGTYHVARVDNEARITWGYEATDETRTFTLTYDVTGAAIKHADVAELYWQFVEPKHDWEAAASRVHVRLPGAPAQGQLRAWAHGPPWGEITLGRDWVEMQCVPLPRNEMIEARIIFPAHMITSSPRQMPGAALSRIEAEEKDWAEKANLRRSAARLRLGLEFGLPILLIGFGVALWIALYLAYGREYREPNPPRYEREPPAPWTPCQVSYLWNWEQLGPNDVTATTMDLVRRGALRLVVSEEVRSTLAGLLGRAPRQEYAIERVTSFSGELRDSERYLINAILFHQVKGDLVSLSALRKRTQREPRAAYQRYQSWQALAKKECAHLQVVDPASRRATGIGTAAGVLVFLSTFPLAALLRSPTVLATGFGGFGLIVASQAIRRRTREAAHELRRWQAFRRYLTDFSQLREYPPPAVALWEQYLVYGITLGVAERVIEQFRELYPQVEGAARAQGTFAHWVTPSGSPLRGVDAVSSALTSFSRTLATATSALSSTSGGGGGFSGGGGGGGGGGSSGAR